MTLYIVNNVPFNLSCVGCELYLYFKKFLSYTKHVKKFKPTENNEIGVLSDLSSHELYSQERDSNIQVQSLVWKKKRFIVFFLFQYIFLNDTVTEPVSNVGHH